MTEKTMRRYLFHHFLLPLMGVLFVAALSQAARADEARWVGDGYVGVAVGTTSIEKGYTAKSSNGAVGKTAENSDEVTAGVYAGYQFTPNFAIEGGFHKLFRHDVKQDVTLPGGLLPDFEINGDIEGYNLYLAGVGRMRATERIALFVKAGVHYNETHIVSKGHPDQMAIYPVGMQEGLSNLNYVEKEKGWDLMVGAGAEYALTERVSLRAEYMYAETHSKPLHTFLGGMTVRSSDRKRGGVHTGNEYIGFVAGATQLPGIGDAVRLDNADGMTAGAYAGFLINPKFAIEAGFHKIFERSTSRHIGSSRGRADIEGYNLYLAALGRMQPTARTILFVKGGIHYSEIDGRTDAEFDRADVGGRQIPFPARDIELTEDESDTGILLGVGAEYALTERVWLRAEYNYAGTDSVIDDPLHSLLGGVTLRF